MRRRIAEHTKVIRRRHDSASKQMLPDAVHRDASRERVAVGEHAVSKFHAPTAARILQWFTVIQRRQQMPSGGWSDVVVVAANELLNKKFTNEQLIHFAMEGEFVASGARS